MFYLIGTINKTEYSLRYKNGQLSGDLEAIKKHRKKT